MNDITTRVRATRGVSLLLAFAAAAALISVGPTTGAEAMPRSRGATVDLVRPNPRLLVAPKPRLWSTPSPRLLVTPNPRLRSTPDTPELVHPNPRLSV